MERTENAWKNEFEIDMMHTVRTVEAALPWIEKSDAGSILVISSVSGLEFDFTSPAGEPAGELHHRGERGGGRGADEQGAVLRTKRSTAFLATAARRAGRGALGPHGRASDTPRCRAYR